jgi:hypothetical protein
MKSRSPSGSRFETQQLPIKDGSATFVGEGGGVRFEKSRPRCISLRISRVNVTCVTGDICAARS